MYEFILAFNKLKGYSMVAHPVGVHHDHFRYNKSVENKIMLILSLRKKSTLGHDGSITGNTAVFVLFDW
jgi:hypothetical protein